MLTYREQMQALAKEVIRSRSERKSFLEKNRRDAIRRRHSDERSRKRIVAHERRDRLTLLHGLKLQRTRNHNAVQRLLTTLAQGRRSRASHLKTSLQRNTQRNRASVASMLEVHRRERKAEALKQSHSATDVIVSIQQEVTEIREATQALLTGYAQERHHGRRAWTRAISRQC